MQRFAADGLQLVLYYEGGWRVGIPWLERGAGGMDILRFCDRVRIIGECAIGFGFHDGA